MARSNTKTDIRTAVLPRVRSTFADLSLTEGILKMSSCSQTLDIARILVELNSPTDLDRAVEDLKTQGATIDDDLFRLSAKASPEIKDRISEILLSGLIMEPSNLIGAAAILVFSENDGDPAALAILADMPHEECRELLYALHRQKLVSNDDLESLLDDNHFTSTAVHKLSSNPPRDESGPKTEPPTGFDEKTIRIDRKKLTR